MLKRTTDGWPARPCSIKLACCVGGRGARGEGLRRELGWIAYLVQILVVVANIQMSFLKAEVEKVSVGTELGHGLVGPNPRGKPFWKGAWSARRGNSASESARRGKGKSAQDSDTWSWGYEAAKQLAMPDRA